MVAQIQAGRVTGILVEGRQEPAHYFDGEGLAPFCPGAFVKFASLKGQPTFGPTVSRTPRASRTFITVSIRGLRSPDNALYKPVRPN